MTAEQAHTLTNKIRQGDRTLDVEGVMLRINAAIVSQLYGLWLDGTFPKLPKETEDYLVKQGYFVDHIGESITVIRWQN